MLMCALDDIGQTTTSITAYLLDSYPGASGEVVSWPNFCKSFNGESMNVLPLTHNLEQGEQLEAS